MKRVYISAVLLSALIVFFNASSPSENKEIKVEVLKGWPKPAYDFSKNPVTENGFQLGRKLFFDPLLSADSTISCASCHLQYTNFTHVDHALSHGIYGLKGTRNTLAIVNPAWSKSFMWDGGINNLEVQPLGPIANPVEMNSSLPDVISKLKRSEEYRHRFKIAFGDSAEITGQLMLKALSQFMSTFVSCNSKYDKVMRKEEGVSFTEQEAKGLKLFRKHCESCHKEPLFTNNEFDNNGLPVDAELKDGGRIKITHKIEDSLKFKVPSLRNVEVSYPYMHDGRFRNLQMVLFHYTAGLEQTFNVSSKLKKPIEMSEDDKRCMIAFLKTLTDKEFLSDPKYKAPEM